MISRATDCRAAREEENEGVRSMMGIERKEVVVDAVVSRESRYFWASRAALRESEFPFIKLSATG